MRPQGLVTIVSSKKMKVLKKLRKTVIQMKEMVKKVTKCYARLVLLMKKDSLHLYLRGQE